MSDNINVVAMTSKEYDEFLEKTYNKFLDYYLNTDLFVIDIYKKLDITYQTHNKVARHIRRRLREDGYDTDKRDRLIKKGEWRREE